MSQELGLIPKEENYVNPYKESEILKVKVHFLCEHVETKVT